MYDRHMAFGSAKKLDVAEKVTDVAASLRKTADSASGAVLIVGIVALAALVLATVAVVRSGKS